MDHDCFNMAVQMSACKEAWLLEDEKYHFMDFQFRSTYSSLTSNPTTRGDQATTNPLVPNMELELELVSTPLVNGVGGKVRHIMVAHWLPLRVAEDLNSLFGLLAPVTFISTLLASAESKVIPSSTLDEYLMENFSCLLMYLDSAHHNEFYVDFCKHYLWPLVHYLLPLSSAHNDNVALQHWYVPNVPCSEHAVRGPRYRGGLPG
ncbi:hypothetical protein BDA96_03G141000 [Sorghum bicolor]|uniref:Uncharacterized protein n=2 Tax=Sorghum bicolor TaxID=4558 RepID=A0A921RE53_SORBI|nr:hypothetical protein BDA96_03G141000 [Sorghum bicolor]OQU86729.1 hypothetical protein SORBI_3003G134950 [Sorghum bicolor]